MLEEACKGNTVEAARKYSLRAFVKHCRVCDFDRREFADRKWLKHR